MPVMTFVGSRAPDFRLLNQDKKWVSLTDLVRESSLLLVFYPGDFTPVCTKQLCAYQESFSKFSQAGMKIVGISANPPEEHVKFRAKHGFQFDLLTDSKKEVAKLYSITSLFMFGGTSRAVFILAKGGKVLYRYVEPTPLTHRKPGELVEVIEKLKAAGQLQ